MDQKYGESLQLHVRQAGVFPVGRYHSLKINIAIFTHTNTVLFVPIIARSSLSLPITIPTATSPWITKHKLVVARAATRTR
jgi:hypothetical protein